MTQGGLFELSGEFAVKRLSRKEAGAYYTPDDVVSSLLKWAVRHEDERLLDPSCGDGRFIAGHLNSVGIEQDFAAAREAIARAPWALVHEGDFFLWAASTHERFECAAGNPPFIRYQTFKGQTRERALALCRKLGANFTGLASSWAPFLVAAASLLKPGGRMAFVVPAEIGHAPYSAPLLEYLVANFSLVHLVAVRDKLFPELSEDCWLLYAEGFGSATEAIRFTALERFRPMAEPPRQFQTVPMNEWRHAWNRRLRPFLLPSSIRDLYRNTLQHPDSRRFGDLASIGIGYVSGANDFFHLRPSTARKWGIPEALLRPTVRNGRALPERELTQETVHQWLKRDEPILLLNLPKTSTLPAPVRRYLETSEGKLAREAYKCRVRDPWYSVPDVKTPEFFLTYMSGREPGLVRNNALCTCTNSVHSVRLRQKGAGKYLAAWGSPFVRLSCEIEGHPLGGGMLKLEPREAGNIVLPAPGILGSEHNAVIEEGLSVMHQWRHYADA